MNLLKSLDLMNLLKSLLRSKLKFTILQSVIILFLSSIFLTLFMFWLQPNPMTSVFTYFIKNNFLDLLLNWLPVILLMLLFLFASRNLVVSVSLPSFIFLIMSIVNRNKVMYRNDPFVPWDIMLGGELLGVIKSFGAKTIIFAVLGIILFAAATFVCLYYIKNDKIIFKISLPLFGATILACFLLNFTVYSSEKLYNSLYLEGSIYNTVSQFNSRGFMYCFIFRYNNLKIAKPDTYDKQSVEMKISEFAVPNPDKYTNMKKPHILLILSEGFSELALNDNIYFDGYEDPLENYKKLKEESIAGTIVVPAIGGGTADTEFDILTGVNSRHFRSSPFSYRLINKKFESLPSVLNSIGYRSLAIHPGYPWFYNRENVFKFFGFEKFYSVDDFENQETKGMYITEKITFDKTIELFEEHFAYYPDMPLFSMVLTIQNHGPYYDKYLADTNFNTTLPVSESDRNTVSNYFEGIKDADRELKRITDYFRENDEPVVIIYYGDHLPALTQEAYGIFYPDLYELDSMQSLINVYRTPFIIWQNEAAKELTEIEKNYTASDNTALFSANYLGAFALDLLGYTGISPFYDYVNAMRAKYPVIFETQSFYPDGKSTANVPYENKEDLKLYYDWEIYKVFDEK